LVAAGRQRTDEMLVRMERALISRAGKARTTFAALASKLEALSPLAVLDRGYSLAIAENGKLVRSASDVAPGDTLSLRFHRGRAATRVLTTDPEDGEKR
jgi:exodeoxyribonuclease VII large subunit